MLKKLADAALRKVSPSSVFEGSTPDPIKTAGQPPAKSDMTNQDKISFALKHRALGDREVKIRSMGMATGKVTGIDAPHIVVHLTTGQYVHVPPEDLIV